MARLALLFAVVVTFWPTDAYAGIGNQCVAELASIDASGTDGDAQSLCGDGNLVVRRISHLEVPICLSEGASAIAPLPLIPTDGAAAEPSKDCSSLDLPSEVTRGDNEPISKTPPPPHDAALPEMPTAPLPLPASARVLARVEASVCSHAHPVGVYRPPRD